MGRIGAPRAHQGRVGRGLTAALALLALGTAGCGSERRPPVVWHDAVADPTTTTGAASDPSARTASTSAPDGSTTTSAAPGSGDPSTAPPPGLVSSTGPAPSGTPATTTTNLPTGTVRPDDPLAGVRIEAEGPRRGYDRNLFGNWTDTDHDRCDTREEILRAQSTTPAQIDYSGSSCKVIAGDWASLYDGVTLSDRTEVQIDHVVALAEAWDSGAAAWDATRRRDFANDLVHPQLLAVSGSSNQSKSDHDAAEWQPPRAQARCAYASDIVAVKRAWDLSADLAEVAALRTMLATCPGGRPAPTPTPGSPPTPPGSSTSPTTRPPVASTTTTTVTTGTGADLPTITGLDCAGERVSVRNGGGAAIDLSGWTIHDDGAKHTFTFPTGYRLAPGAAVTIRSGGPAGPGELQWVNSPVWNNDGDLATLVDRGGTARSTRSC